MNNKLVIIGAGKFGREILSWNKTYFTEYNFLDNRPNILDKFNYSSKILGDAETYEPQDGDLFVCAIGDPIIKKNICSILENKGAIFINIMHPSAVIADHVKLGKGNIICPNSIISCDTVIGNHNAINCSTTLGHDCIVDNFCQINVNVNIGGGTHIKNCALINSGVSIVPDCIIGENSIIGIGSVVLNEVKNDCTVFGNPARVISYSK